MRYITSADINAMLRDGRRELILGPNDQITDLVAEQIKRKGIRIIRGTDEKTVLQHPSVQNEYSNVLKTKPLSVMKSTGYGGEYDLVILNGTLVIPEVGRVAMNLCVREGKIIALTADTPPAKRVVDASGKYVLPGIIDPHTHLGLYASLETELESETRSAVLGGVTTIGTFFNHTGSYLPTITMLENSIPHFSHIDIAPHFTLRDEQQLSELQQYSARGMNSFKVYMCGVKGLYPHQEDGFILKTMERLSQMAADPVLCIHAENASIIDYAETEGSRTLEEWRESHPNVAESEAVVRAAYLSEQSGARIYLVHNSCKESMDSLRRVKHKRMYVETTSPYLTLDTASMVGAYGKMLPPFREPESRLALWQGIREGLIDSIGTDNVTMTSAEKKTKDGMAGAYPGYPALGTHLVSVLDEGFFRQEVPLETLVPLMTMNPAKIFGLYPRKGTLLPGSDADIVVVDMENSRTVDVRNLLSRSDFSLYQGKTLRGWPVCTIKGGNIVALNGRIVDDEVRGTILRHG